MTQSNRYKNLKRVIIFILGVIITLILTQFWNNIFPKDPVVVKEVNDSITVVHNYKFLNDDSTEINLKRKFENLKLLNDYEEEIEKRIKRIEIKSNQLLSPNLILIDRVCKNEGWIQRKASSFFEMTCPKSTDKYFIFEPKFLNPEFIKEIKYFRLLVYRFNNKNSKYIFYDEQFEVKSNSNFIQIVNDFEKGSYEIRFGFILERDCEKKYPEFYQKSCRIEITGANNGS